MGHNSGGGGLLADVDPLFNVGDVNDPLADVDPLFNAGDVNDPLADVDPLFNAGGSAELDRGVLERFENAPTGGPQEPAGPPTSAFTDDLASRGTGLAPGPSFPSGVSAIFTEGGGGTFLDPETGEFRSVTQLPTVSRESDVASSLEKQSRAAAQGGRFDDKAFVDGVAAKKGSRDRAIRELTPEDLRRGTGGERGQITEEVQVDIKAARASAAQAQERFRQQRDTLDQSLKQARSQEQELDRFVGQFSDRDRRRLSDMVASFERGGISSDIVDLATGADLDRRGQITFSKRTRFKEKQDRVRQFQEATQLLDQIDSADNQRVSLIQNRKALAQAGARINSLPGPISPDEAESRILSSIQPKGAKGGDSTTRAEIRDVDSAIKDLLGSREPEELSGDEREELNALRAEKDDLRKSLGAVGRAGERARQAPQKREEARQAQGRRLNIMTAAARATGVDAVDLNLRLRKDGQDQVSFERDFEDSKRERPDLSEEEIFKKLVSVLPQLTGRRAPKDKKSGTIPQPTPVQTPVQTPVPTPRPTGGR